MLEFQKVVDRVGDWEVYKSDLTSIYRQVVMWGPVSDIRRDNIDPGYLNVRYGKTDLLLSTGSLLQPILNVKQVKSYLHIDLTLV